jgi:glutamate-1-semialdehyde aminotransferase
MDPNSDFLGYHEALRNLTKKYGTLLIIDETHTICCGVGGYTAAYGLKPDILTIGKPIGSGMFYSHALLIIRNSVRRLWNFQRIV